MCLCSFVVALLQWFKGGITNFCYNSLELGFEGGALIWGEANGDADVDLSLLAVPAAQGLAWFVLSFSALYCKFKVSERFPFLLRAWWFLSFVICLCTLYVDAA